jgi:RNA polymerase sigma-70 factor (ECF subfamily)
MEQDFLKQIDLHKALIYKVCHIYECREDARSDLFQDIIAQLWRAFPRYNPDLKWTTWAYRIALNVAITQRRRARLQLLPFAGLLRQNVEKSVPDTPYDSTTDERIEALHKAIAQLNQIEKGLVLLWLDGVSYTEMAEITGLSESNVGAKLNRIKSKLKLMLTHGKA